MLPTRISACAPAPRLSLHSTAWILIGTIVVVVLYPVLLMRGMSLDGVIYATIARNMAQGFGDFWHPAYTDSIPLMYDTPPLGFWLQSWFFRLLGDHYWVERLYSLLTALPTTAILVLIWWQLTRALLQYRALAWLPIALWVVMPNWSWMYRHNCLENTMGVFTALSIYAALRVMERTRWWAAWIALAAICLPTAVLTKGPVGLFPAAAPAILWLTMRPVSFGKALVIQLALLLVSAAAVGGLLLDPAAREFLSNYFQQQVLTSLQGRRELVNSSLGRFYLLGALPRDLLVPIIAAGLSLVWARRNGLATSDRALRSPAMFCLLTAMSGSLPIMISPKQTAFYAAPSWPFYAMALALWCLPAVASITTRLSERAAVPRVQFGIRYLATLAVVSVVALSPVWAGRIYRDRNVIDDVNRIAMRVHPHALLAISPELKEAWGLHAYLYRNHYISVGTGGAQAYYLDWAEAQVAAPPGCILTGEPLALYRLYEFPSVATRPLGSPIK